MSIVALSGYRVFGMPIVTKATAHFLFSFAVLVWAGVMLVTRAMSAEATMPLLYVVIGHFFGTQATKGTPPMTLERRQDDRIQ